MSGSIFHISRRGILKAGAAGMLATPFLMRNAAAAEKITVADPGGPYQTGFGAAFYDPYRAAGGNLNIVARDSEPTSQIKAMVDARSYLWNVVSITLSSRRLLAQQGLLEPFSISGSDWDGLIPAAKHEDWMGTNVYGSIIATRTDIERKPQNWKDFYDTKNFPGRRALAKSPIHTLEGALIADGVDPKDLYPLDVDRAFKKLDQIKPEIAVWWTSFTQTTQLLQSGEVDMLHTSNARAQAAVDGGAPVEIIWDGALYGIEGWAIPKGAPNKEEAERFIAFCANGERQSAYTEMLAYGPTNSEAFKFINADRARALPTEPSNFERMVPVNDDWWGENKDKMFERYNTWLLQ